MTTYRKVDIGGVEVFYREAGPVGAPALLLLHGFPSSSQMFVRLMDALAGEYRVIAPDYLGFGFSQTPPRATFTYTFDSLAEATERFLEHIGLTRFSMYMFDFGAPIGMRIAEKHPKWIEAVISQNGNIYEEGLGPVIREVQKYWDDREAVERNLSWLLTLDGTRWQYMAGIRDPASVDPAGYTLAYHLLQQPDRIQAMFDLLHDYRHNVERYPRWQTWMKAHRPPTLAVWGRRDPIFIPTGAEAFLRDVPDAEVHLLDSGHFALEEELEAITGYVRAFLASRVPARKAQAA